jgi:hypothetical protein
MTFGDPYRTIIVEPIELPEKRPREKRVTRPENPTEPDPAETPQPAPEREPAKQEFGAWA